MPCHGCGGRLKRLNLISSLGAGGVLPWCGYDDAPARDPLWLRPPLLLPRFTQPEPHLSLRGPWFRNSRLRWRERRARLLAASGGVWRASLPIPGQPENRRRCWRRCGSPAKEARYVRYLDATLDFFVSRTWLRVFLPWPRAGLFPEEGWRAQGLDSSRIAAGVAPLQHRPSHSPPAVARPLSSPSPTQTYPAVGDPLCPSLPRAGAPGARSRPGCAQALHTAGAWPASLRLCLAFLGVDGPKHAGEWGTG
jgi:hypothetical protein